MAPSSRLLGVVIILIASNTSLHATHLRAGEIQVQRMDCSSLTFQITIVVYVNTNSSVLFGGEGSQLFFGDGTSQSVPEIMHQVVIDDQLKVGRASFTIIHTYSAFGKFIVSYTEPNRNDGVVNMDQSVTTSFYLESGLLIEPGVCNSSPVLLVPPIDRGCSGVAFYHNTGAVDANNDSLSFEFIVPQRDKNVPVNNYSYPHNARFYSGIPINAANEKQNGPPALTINPKDGTITWDAPGNAGEYSIAIKIREWKYNSNDSSWYESGYIVRDMQIIIEDCTNKRPLLTVASSDYCVIAGAEIRFKVKTADPDFHPVKIEVFSEAFQTNESPVISPPNGVLQSTQPPNDTASVEFIWSTTCNHIRNQPYRIFFKVTDQPPAGPKLVTFLTVNIKVIATAPEYESVVVNPVSKNVTIKWKDYPCANLESVQIWRRVSRFQYEVPECNAGMPGFLKYQLIAEVPATSDSYVDENLSVGAEYCYRLVALIGINKTPGRISLDTCFIPKPAEAPVITNVSVNTTDPVSGSITIRWTPPFDIDQQQYPPPYAYKVYRKKSISELSAYEALMVNPIADTFFLDNSLDTKEFAYDYKVQLFVPALTSAPVDTSSQASSVWLKATPVPEGIELTWAANTPWYNYSERYPYHLVLRSDTGLSGPFILLDSVNVNENDFHYTDRGLHETMKLIKDKYYYYRITTRGTYGNPKILTPLENDSQITGGEVLDIEPPCKPELSIAPTDCEIFSCDGVSYYNELSWNISDPTCSEDVVAYEIFVSEGKDQTFTSLGTLATSTIRHANLTSLAKCYKVLAIDDAGNESDSSEMVCNDNCPYFRLPNVITPGLPDNMNDYLTAYTAENGETSHCARFVKKVELKIFNRWGETVFTNAINPLEDYIFWNGSSDTGKELSSGVYFYTATITFEVSNPDKQQQRINGWISLIR